MPAGEIGFDAGCLETASSEDCDNYFDHFDKTRTALMRMEETLDAHSLGFLHKIVLKSEGGGAHVKNLPLFCLRGF